MDHGNDVNVINVANVAVVWVHYHSHRCGGGVAMQCGVAMQYQQLQQRPKLIGRPEKNAMQCPPTTGVSVTARHLVERKAFLMASSCLDSRVT